MLCHRRKRRRKFFSKRRAADLAARAPRAPSIGSLWTCGQAGSRLAAAIFAAPRAAEFILPEHSSGLRRVDHARLRHAHHLMSHARALSSSSNRTRPSLARPHQNRMPTMLRAAKCSVVMHLVCCAGSRDDGQRFQHHEGYQGLQAGDKAVGDEGSCCRKESCEACEACSKQTATRTGAAHISGHRCAANVAPLKQTSASTGTTSLLR